MSLLRSRNCLSSRRHRLLLPLVLLAAAAALWALYETPYDGPWIGTTSEGRAVSFTVSNGGSEWGGFLYTIAFFCPAIGGTVTTGITTSGPGTITDGEISYSGPNGVAFTGAFDTPTTASGTFTLTDYAVTHGGLPYPPYVHTDIIDHSGTWTATFDGAVNVLVVTSPNGGETWAAGSHHDITWSSVGEIADVKLEYSTNGGTDWTIIVETTPNSESYPWTLPGSPSPSCLVRISDASVPSVFDASNAVFSIVPTIPALERQALIAIYNATAGDSWNNSYGWKTPPLDPDGFAMPGTEGNWAGMTVDVANSTVVQLNLIYNNLAGSIPPEIGDLGGLRYIDLSGNNLSGSIPSDLGGLANLQSLSLYSNQLSGAIPAEIGGLEDLQTLMLFQNQLSGPIPAELGGLTNLFILHLGDNRLSGAIPAALSGLVNAQQIILNSNWLTGPIPAELGGLVNLAYLYLNGNQLSGPIPTSMTGMVGLEAGGLNLGYNALYAGEPALVAFLNSKDPDWASTQTVAPTETTATALDGARILVSWLPIAYTADAGSYRILNSLDPGGPYSEIGQTENKSASAAEIAGLTPGETYYFVVRAHTDAHTYNPNAVESEDSSEAWAVAWTKLNVRIAGVVTVGAVPLPGVVMAGLAGNPITDSNGAYDVTLAAGWSGTVTPTLAGYTFDPAFRAYSVLMDDQLGHDYAATPPTYTISGTVTVGSTGLAGVTMSGLPGNPVTDASGDYSGTVTHGWSGTVAPAHTYYTFDPVSQTYANVTSNTAGQDYAASLITTPQRQALIALYDSTNGGSWYDNSGWKTEPLYPDGFALPGTEGTWFGLTVDTGTLAVTEINLVGNGLTGTLPSALANLTQLHGLYIGDNFMSGSIPPELGTITTLNHLHLYNDQLTGSIPPELGDLVNLQSLTLYTNQLTGSIPPELGSLSDLVQLRLNENQLSGSIPPELGSLTNLANLSLFWNSLDGPIPAELANLTNLQILVLSHNQLTGTIPPGFGSLVNLVNLGLDGNHFSGTIPEGLGSLVNLMILGLGSNQLSGAIPSELGNLTQLVELHLNGNQLAGLIPTSFMNLTALTPNALVTDLGHNAVYATNPDLITFLNSKDADWAATQTIAPTQITATAMEGANILVSWLPIPYTADAGSYRVYISQISGSGYTLAGQTDDKTDSSVQVNGLTPGETYYFVVQTRTDVHANNQNTVDSENSSEASATAWMQLTVNISGTITAGGSPLEGVVMSGLTGGPVTNALGVYTGTEAAGWSGTVTPTLAGYMFSPAFRAYSVLAQDQLAQDYSATPQSYVISGSVTMGATGIAGVTMSGLPGNPVTDASGDYSGMVALGWSGTVTPTHASYAFDPVSQTYTNVNANMSGQDYLASLITTPQRQALIAFYISTNGDSWANNAGWKTEPLYPDGFAMPGTEGTWFGVVVNPETLAVTEIYHANNNLTGSLPAALGDLTGLQFLNIQWNAVTGSIPATLGNLTNLIQIRLDMNGLSGGIPAALGGLENLQELSLSNNPLGGTIPPELGGLTNLTWLRLNNDSLTGGLPPELGNLTNLDYLGLDANQLTGSIPPEWGGMTSLTTMLLHSNQLSGAIPAEFGSLTSLRSLTFTGNQFNGSLPPEFGNLSSLEYAYLGTNQFSGELPAQIGNLHAMEILGLDGNQLSGSIPATVGNMTNLRSLGLQGNRLSGPIPPELGNLTRLGEIRLGGNKLEGPLPASLMNLTALYDYAADIGYNALFTSDEALITFLNSKDADWAATQTIAPTQVTASAMEGANILVSWLPIPYAADAGSYRVYISQTSGSGYTLAGQTDDKTDSSVQVNGLTPGVTYYFVVQTHTDVHGGNPNAVDSEYSTEASATAWMQLTVNISGTIMAGGSPLEGVVMGGLTESPVTNASGMYTGTEAAGWSGTMTPALAGYTFAPVSRTYATVMTNLTGQDYAATPVSVPTITVTSPNGGESWALGSSHPITWTQTALTGSVTIDLYKGGVWQKILGTPAATAGTFSWPIALTEIPGTDYTVLVWQGSVSDDSNANFRLVRTVKVDFNSDGQEDLVWRYQGIGEYQGWNCVWLMNQTEGLASLQSGSSEQGAGVTNMRKGSAPGLTYETPLDAGSTRIRASDRSALTPMGVEISQVLKSKVAMRSPMESDQTLRAREATLFSVPTMKDAEMISVAADGRIELASLEVGGYLYPQTISDLSWEIAGAGDFNGDGNTDILWRNYGVGDFSGWNVIWYMSGGGVTGYGYLYGISDLDWKIAGTGDFNNDGQMDILWRNYGAGDYSGWNVIWYMTGEGISGYGYLYGISDLDWRIAGTGDFNGDGNTDILWRNYGAGDYSGWNVIWYMNGEGISGYGYLYGISDLGWEIAGTGDFNADGYMDIVWRYYGSGDLQGWNCVWYMQGEGIIGYDYPMTIPDTNWRIVNR